MKTNIGDQQSWYKKSIEPILKIPQPPKNNYMTVPYVGLSTKRSMTQAIDPDISGRSNITTALNDIENFTNSIPNDNNNNNNNNVNKSISLSCNKRSKTTFSTYDTSFASTSTSSTINNNHFSKTHTTKQHNNNLSMDLDDDFGFDDDFNIDDAMLPSNGLEDNNSNYNKRNSYNRNYNNNYNEKSTIYSMDSPPSYTYVGDSSEIASPSLMYSDGIDNSRINNKHIADSSIDMSSRQPSFSSPSLNLSLNSNHSYNTNNNNDSNDNVLQNDQYAVELKELEMKENEINRLVADMIFGGSTDVKKQQSLADERNKIKKKIEEIKQKMKSKPSTSILLDDDIILLDDDFSGEMEEKYNNNNTQTVVRSSYFINKEMSIQSTSSSSTTAVTKREENYPWSKEVKRVLSQVFKLKDFRLNQLEAINTTLKGEDVFVLMPTGGGKSLCYQLPAIVSGEYLNKDRYSVTVVVSPLISLMHDQVEQLCQRGVSAGLLNGVITKDERQSIFRGLSSSPPSIRLIYVTPELIKKSNAFQNIVQKLYDNNQLARFVIDEAHCVSQWGHDFRPDYKSLGDLKRQYSDVPIIALTATANQRVQKDIIHNLYIPSCKIFKQSFNRSNLKYQIIGNIPKVDQRINDIYNFIKREYSNQCGIIYCTTRKQCETVATKLKEGYGIKTDFYHAKRESDERIQLQEKWQRGEYQVLVATVAFGMGIDKANVRFVIHFALPSSVEGYYQETGRAGRDGLDATCRLYFSYHDTQTHYRIIDNGEGRYEVKENQRNNLKVMTQYCMNTIDCRRKLLLSYFGENFNPSLCRGSTICDNCKKNQGKNIVSKDYTSWAVPLLKLLEGLSDMGEKVTLIQLCDIFRGHLIKRFQNRGIDQLDGFGAVKGNDKRDEINRLANHLISSEMLVIKSEINTAGYSTSYAYLGVNANNVIHGRQRVVLYITEDDNNSNKRQRYTPTEFTCAVTDNTSKRQPASHQSSGRRSLPKSFPPSVPKVITELNETQTKRYIQMRERRAAVMGNCKLKDPKSVYVDTELKRLAYGAPQNEREFLDIISDQERFNRYGKQYFLPMCKEN